MRHIAFVFSLAVALLAAPVVRAEPKPAQDLPDETASYDANLLLIPSRTPNSDLSDPDSEQQEAMEETSETVNLTRPQRSEGLSELFDLPEGMIIRGVRQGLGVGVEF